MNSTLKKLTLIALVISFAAMMATTSSKASVSPARDGAATFKAKCAMCHGADGSGDTAMGKKFGIRDLRSAEVQAQSDAQLATIISKGKGKMPAYENSLGADAINELVAFIRKLGGR
ncbi:MAG TPA: cytochrome c [Blastocatellia bacterium]|nr:cytochrome c [Blastocatellia bacterium]